MSELLGMNPEQVRSQAALVRAQLSVLDTAASTVERAAWASMNPASYGIQPGGLVIAPFAIGGTQAAVAQVRAARQSVLDLAQRLFHEADQQVAVSSRGDASYRGGKVPKIDEDIRFPAWLAGILVGLGFLGDMLDFAPDLKALLGKGGKSLLLARQQWVNGSVRYARYRIGLLQWGRSTYKNNPVRLVLRAPQTTGWKIPTWAVKTSRVLGPVGLAITAVTDGAGAWEEQWNKSSDLSDGDRHVRAGVAAATVGGASAGGAALGAWGGAALGAAIGSVFPGPGTAIGAVVGGIIGGIAGSELGEGIGKWFNGLW